MSVARAWAAHVAVAIALGAALGLPAYAQSPSTQFAGSTAEQLVAELWQFPASLPGVAPSNGVLDPTEQRRRSIYDRLRGFGSAAIPALNLGLTDPNVQIRRNVALVLLAAGGSFEPTISGLDIRDSLPALIAALADTDARVNELAAQAVGTIGPDASSAVPALIALLGSADEGSRNSACLGLAGIGPSAREALPALRNALTDPSVDVRWFARRAIDTIESQR